MVSVDIGKILVQRGIIIYCKETATSFEVEGTTDINNSMDGIVNIASGETVGILINHGPKSETVGVVDIVSCELTTMTDPENDDVQTIVSIAKVVWNDNSAEITQYLRGDVFCTIHGTNNE